MASRDSIIHPKNRYIWDFRNFSVPRNNPSDEGFSDLLYTRVEWHQGHRLAFKNFIKGIYNHNEDSIRDRVLITGFRQTRPSSAMSGIKAHRLAFKIFESTGETEFSDEKPGWAVERYCLPNVIDALNAILGGSNR